MPLWQKSIFVSFLLLLLASVSGVSSTKIITLESIDIFVNHNFLPFKPTVYFQCQGEKVTILPDVKEVNHLYTFNGDESWQPLADLPDDKCKRCGVYQKAMFKADDEFDEWELCLDDFEDGTCAHVKEDQFNATFRSHANGTALSNHSSDSSSAQKRKRVALVVTISIVSIAVVVASLVAGFKYWQKKKKQQDQARFLKMFEDVDDIEDELGLGPL